MKNLKSELANSIVILKIKQEEEFVLLKSQYFKSIESIKPINLMKFATQELVQLPNFKSNLFKIVIGIGANYFSKSLINENSPNLVKRILGQVFKVVSKQV